MGKKKIKDLTLGEIKDICSKKNCMDCVFARFVTMGEECPITNIRNEDLETKIEVEEDKPQKCKDLRGCC